MEQVAAETPLSDLAPGPALPPDMELVPAPFVPDLAPGVPAPQPGRRLAPRMAPRLAPAPGPALTALQRLQRLAGGNPVANI